MLKDKAVQASQKNAPEGFVEGILLVNKPANQTSFSLVRQLRKLLNVKKIGHAGTLDPFATGLMVMLIGRNYTKLSDHFLHQDKEYIAELTLGISTDSYDCDGQITEKSSHIPSHEDVEEALTHFQGEVEQIPPMFSAKKVQGKKLYELARQGQTIERKPIHVTLTTTLLSYKYPHLSLHIHCSKGTYIRTLAHDLGNLLNCGAYLSALKRTRSGQFHLDQAVDGETLAVSNLSTISSNMIHID